MTARPSVLLHACCAVCAGYPLEKLRADYEPVVYFCNPNIFPREEYERRRDECRRGARTAGCVFVEDDVERGDWERAVRGLEAEPEGGRRCLICFRYRLARTAAYARERGIGFFTTTLTVSPRKKSALLLALGAELAREAPAPVFIPEDFKKKDGYGKTMAIARREGFYRQNYCGCQPRADAPR
ncbi:MAG: epoxyqueuosine reductase QueH [Gracilibacteraceae bacterium]|nr:epoxyqueuosine reductase QueH [Gracilibacteraceae bacterium]